MLGSALDFPSGAYVFDTDCCNELSLKHAIIFLSEFAKSQIETKVPEVVEKERPVIPHGISPEFRKAVINPENWPNSLPEREYLFYPSPLTYYKNQVELVEAFHKAKSSFSRDIMLVLAGSGVPSYVSSVREQIKRFGLEQDVILLGHVNHNEIPELYAHANAVVFPSSCENCPVTLLEALSAEKPILCSLFPPMPEFAREAVQYVEPESVEALSQGLTEIVNNEVLRTRLTGAARDEATKWKFERTAEATWRVLYPGEAEELKTESVS